MELIGDRIQQAGQVLGVLCCRGFEHRTRRLVRRSRRVQRGVLDSPFLSQSAEIERFHQHANITGQRGGFGKEIITGAGGVVPAAGCHPAHRNHDWNLRMV